MKFKEGSLYSYGKDTVMIIKKTKNYLYCFKNPGCTYIPIITRLVRLPSKELKYQDNIIILKRKGNKLKLQSYLTYTELGGYTDCFEMIDE